MSHEQMITPWENRRFKLGAALSKLKRPGAMAVHPLESPAVASSLNVLTRPEFSWDYSHLVVTLHAIEPSQGPLPQPLIWPEDSSLSQDWWECMVRAPAIENVLGLVQLDGLSIPPNELIELLLPSPSRAGKQYGPEPERPTQHTLEGMERRCRHGLAEATCSHCRRRQEERAARSAPAIDPFDAIFPMLQPPLGADFDNPVVFPPGQAPLDYQRPGIRFLAERTCALLADEMGLGKSIQAIVALKLLFRTSRVRSVVIITKKSLLTDWEHKLWAWAPELGAVRVEGNAEQRDRIWSSGARVLVTNYERVREDMLSAPDGTTLGSPKTRNVDVVVLDEAQAIKNPSTGLYRGVTQVNGQVRWALTGTPLENRPEELVTLFSYLKPGLLRYDDALDPGKVKRLIEPYTLRRLKANVLQLEPIIYADRWLSLTPEQRATYDYAEREGVVQLNALGERATLTNVLALISKLKQICNLDPVTGASCKTDWLEEHLDEVVAANNKSLVFSQYPEVTLRPLLPRLERFGASLFDGSLSGSSRDRILEQFSGQDERKVLLMSLQAGSLGLTITTASDVVHFDHWWNPAVARQAEGRTHRIGQTRSVLVNALFVEDTIEQRIFDVLARKTVMFEEYMGDLTDQKGAKSLTEDDLFGLFGLKAPARKRVADGATVGHERVDLGGLNGIEFEKLIADVYRRLGYSVRLTPASHDRGIDLYACRDTPSGRDTLAIQCKHYYGRTVGVEHARQLYGVIQSEPSITKGVLVTSGRFTPECAEFTRRLRIDMCDQAWVLGMLARFGL